jgi:hypothetical protein
MRKTIYTREGLQKLAEIVFKARNGEGMRPFSIKTGLSHSTIDRLEKAEISQPDFLTLEKLSPFVGYSVQELIAICSGDNAVLPARTYYQAEQVFPIVDQLPKHELAKMVFYLVKKIAAGSLPPKPVVQNEDYSHMVAGLNPGQVSKLLRAIALKVEAEDTSL